MTRQHQHYHWDEGRAQLNICWRDGARHREKQLAGVAARAVHQHLLRAPGDEHAIMILDVVIDGAVA